MQEHKYHNQDAWKEGALPHAKTSHLEDVHHIVYEHFDPDMKPKNLDGDSKSNQTGDFKSAWAIQEEKDEAEHKAMMDAGLGAHKEVPHALVDDWTGHKYGKYWESYGKEPFPPVAKKLDKTGREVREEKDVFEKKPEKEAFL